jgi:type II secretory pathway pseudopilin PulG
LIEAVVVLAVIAILSSVVVLRLTGSADPAADAAAKSSLVVFQQIEQDAQRGSSVPLDASAITSGSYDRGSVTFTANASTTSSEVSVVVEGTVVIGASSAGADCWALRLDFAPTPSSPLQWWFLDEDVESCTPSLFTSADFPADGTGQSPNRPSILP